MAQTKMSHNVEYDELVSEMEEAPSFASSIPVPNVQEMVRNNPLQVPQRYVRSREELDKVSHMPHLSSKVPFIDLALLSRGNKEELLKLDLACKEWGFFQIVNHGVQKELLQKMKDAASEFFELPAEEKKKYAMDSSDIQGYGQAYVVSEEQTLDWSDALMLVTYPTRYRKLQFWPKTPEGFKEIIEAYASEVRRVSQELLSLLSVIMGMQKHVLLELHQESLQALRVNYYPPCSTPEQVLGLSPHSDANTITLLMQDDDITGLEIRHQGGWVPVTPISDALVVNVGDVIEEAPTLAPSIPLENVQEMVRNDPFHVPIGYVTSQEELEKANYMPHLSSEIPVIDLALLSNGNKEELLKFDVACKEWGFFQIVNHGVQTELMQKMKDAASEFFNLPIEEKNKYAMVSSETKGYGKGCVVSGEQTLDWSDSLILITYPTQYRKLQFWPKTPEGFMEIIEAYASEVRRVGEELLSSMSVIMGMRKHVLFGLHKESYQVLRLNYYPPCSTPEQVQGLSPHSDTSSITLLMQDDDVTGLEIRHQGGWVPVNPIPDALVVNVGDVTEIWSNGKYKSVEHRAMTNKNKERISYGLFLCPQHDVEVEPLDHMIDSHNPKLFQKVRYGDYLRQSLKRKLEGKTHLNEAKLKESDLRNQDD
ncbi:Protein SRG1 [Glycine soja]